MTESNQPVTSREYKLMLNTDRFNDRNTGAKTFFDLIEFLIKKEGGTIVEKQDKEDDAKPPTWILRSSRYARMAFRCG